MKMKNLISIGTILSTVATSALGSVFFTVDVGSLQDDAGLPLVGKGMLYLVSSGVDGDFSLPETDGIIGAASDDAIVASWDLTAEVSQGGEYIVSSGEVPFGGGWAEGHSLAILWFPNLTQADQAPEAGEAYGFYRSADGGGGDGWTMPIDGTFLHSLKFFTDAANPLVDGSDVPSFVAAAAFGAGEDAGAPNINFAGLSTAELTPGTTTFSWSGSTALGGGYRIERRLVGDVDWAVLDTVADSDTSFDDDSIGRGKTYEYRVVATNGFGTEASAKQSIETLRSNLANLSTRGLLASGENVLILGFTTQGTGDINLLTRTQGPELARQGFSNVASDPNTKLYQSIWELVDGVPTLRSEFLRENEDWGDSQLAEINGLFKPRTIAEKNSDENSTDSGMALTFTEASTYTIVSSDSGAEEGLAIVEVFDGFEGVPNEAENRLVNLSTRGFVGTGDNVLIGGFNIRGEVDSTLLLRGVGPSLAGRVSNPVQNPKIRLFETVWELVDGVPTANNVPKGENDNWEDDNADAIRLATDKVTPGNNFADGSEDAAMLVTLPPGLYTFIMEGVDAGTGTGLLEVFLAD